MFRVEFSGGVTLFPRMSCDLVVLIRQKLVVPTDAKTAEGLTLTRDWVTASTDISRTRSSSDLPVSSSSHQQPDFRLLTGQGGDGCARPLLMKVADRMGRSICFATWPVA